MKAITLWEPWASLVRMLEKGIETRSWKAPDKLIGQRIAIHTAMKMPSFVKASLRGFAELLGVKEYTGSWLYYLEHGVGPFGKVVATCTLKACYKIRCTRPVKRNGVTVLTAFLEAGDRLIEISGNELAFGDYSPGRYAWILDDIRPLDKPIPAKGRQKIWEWDERSSA